VQNILSSLLRVWRCLFQKVKYIARKYFNFWTELVAACFRNIILVQTLLLSFINISLILVHNLNWRKRFKLPRNLPIVIRKGKVKECLFFWKFKFFLLLYLMSLKTSSCFIQKKRNKPFLFRNILELLSPNFSRSKIISVLLKSQKSTRRKRTWAKFFNCKLFCSFIILVLK
jgi:hypothetical protein